jgi:hypothetical protein
MLQPQNQKPEALNMVALNFGAALMVSALL